MHVHCTHEEDMRAPSVRAMTSESAAGLSQHTSNAIGLVQGLPRPAAASRQAITNRVKAGAHCKIFPLYHQISKKLTAGAVVTSIINSRRRHRRWRGVCGTYRAPPEATLSRHCSDELARVNGAVSL
jgi:hypothetical protein